MSRCTNGTYLKWWVGIDIRQILLEDPGLAELTGGDVYPLVAPENTEGSIILYRRIKYQREYGKMGLMEDVARVELLVITDSYEDGVALASLVDRTLSGTHTNTLEDYQYSLTFTLYDSEETFEDNKFIQSLIFEVK